MQQLATPTIVIMIQLIIIIITTTIPTPGNPGAHQPGENLGADPPEEPSGNPGAPRHSQRAGLRTPKTKVNCNNLHDPSHLKTIGYSTLLSGVPKTTENAALVEYVHGMHVRSEYSSPKFGAFRIVNHTLLSQYTLRKGLQVFEKK